MCYNQAKQDRWCWETKNAALKKDKDVSKRHFYLIWYNSFYWVKRSINQPSLGSKSLLFVALVFMLMQNCLISNSHDTRVHIKMNSVGWFHSHHVLSLSLHCVMNYFIFVLFCLTDWLLLHCKSWNMGLIELWYSCMIQLNCKWKPFEDLYWPQRKLTWHWEESLRLHRHLGFFNRNSGNYRGIWEAGYCFWHGHWGRGSMQHHLIYPAAYYPSF